MYPINALLKKAKQLYNRILPLVILLALVSFSASSQMGLYEFTGNNGCPATNASVTAQPSNATFSDISTVNANCNAVTDQYSFTGWNTSTSINTNQYHQFSITPAGGNSLSLSSISFTQQADDENNSGSNGSTTWSIRSSLDGYAADIATGTINKNLQSPVISLPAGSFSSVGAVTFRIYVINAKDNNTQWSIDNVSIDGSVINTPPTPANPSSNSPQCSDAGVTITANGSAPAGETWYWQTSAAGTSTANSSSTYTVFTSGTYYLRSQDNTTLTWSNGAGSVTVTVNPLVSAPVFIMGSNSLRCLGAATITYNATATNATSITYSIDNASALLGNSINPSTGAVTFAALYVGNTIITATANGCGGPKTATHTVAISSPVGTPAFLLGASSSRCQGATSTTYSANASNTSGITYTLDAASLAGGNTINSTTGQVFFSASWNGTSTITASAAGCAGPKTATHTVTTNPFVTAPVFNASAQAVRCQAAGTATYTATASNTTGITYSLDAASVTGGNTINASNGTVTYAATWSGTTIVTAKAAGCNGPLNSTFTVTINPAIATPVFASGATSTRCQGVGTVTYAATSTNSTSITYSLDATSLANGNTINTSTGAVTYAAAWTGTSTITASAAGCGGPKTATHTVTNTTSVGTPVFAMGAGSSRVQGAGTVTYTATASNTTGITYSLDAASLAGGNTINAATGLVTYSATWNGSATITASAAGCNGPKTAIHIVTINASSAVKQLYLSDPSQSLDRVDPVNTADATTASTTLLSTAGTTNTTFTMSPALCDALTIKAGVISIKNYITVSSGTMPATPAITALLQYGSTTIATLTNPTYNSGVLTWNYTLASDVTVPAGAAISLKITTAQTGVIFRIDYDSQTKPSKIDLPVSTFINVTSLDVYSAAYPGGIVQTTGVGGSVKYIRAIVSDPFGVNDITALNIKITPGSTITATSVATTGCSKVYEYAWTTPATSGSYSIAATAKEGYENTVTHTRNTSFDVCITCAPIAANDSANGAGGNPIVANVLANDYDPNNNMNNASLAIAVQPLNGSAYIANNNIVYLPNGTFQGNDTITYSVCDLTSSTPLCTTAKAFFTVDPLIVDICADASKTHTYYIPYPEDQAYKALEASGSPAMPGNTIRTVISIKVPYPGIKIVWDEWEDGYESNSLNPTQSTTKVWGDGNPFNGIAPGYPSDIIPAGGSIVLDNTMPANPRNSANIFYDGKDKIVSTGQVALTQVSGEPSIMSVQSIKTNVTSTDDFGKSFTIPVGEDFPSRDFKYTALFIRASENNTTVNIDKDNNGTFETTTVLNEGQSYFVNGGVLTGATVASDKPVGVELNSGGVDNYSIRNAPIYPATWYSNTYYTPVPTSDNAADNPKDSSAVMFYNSLSRPIKINWYSGAPASGVINVPAKTTVRFTLAYSTTSTYKFVNLGGESFTAIEIVNSYSPDGSGTSGSAYDWSFNLISDIRLTDYATVAWAPGGLDLDGTPGPDVNGNPIWVTPTMNTTVYVKYDGNVSGNTGSVSPCGLRYDDAIAVNALNYIKIRDNSDNDQSGIAIYTCNGAKIAAAYGEDPRGSTAGNSAYWDVGTTIQPFCKQKLIIAADDYATTLVGQPVTISVLSNDVGFLATIDPQSVTTLGLLQPKHGTVHVNDNGTILYTPAPGFSGLDTFEYNVCSTPSVVCDIAEVVIKISSCPSNGNQNVISGQIFLDKNKDGNNNDGGKGLAGVKVYLYTDGNCNAVTDAGELTDSVTVDNSGFYQFTKYPEKTVEDNFDDGNGGRTCAGGSDGDSPWASNWTDNNDPSTGFCVTGSISVANTDVEITKDGSFGYALRLKDNGVSATRSVDLNNATKAFLTFSYRRKSATLTNNHDVYVQVAKNGTFNTIYTISGDGNTDANYVTVYNQDISAYAASTTAIRFLTGSNVNDADTVYIDDVSIRFLRYPQCYITAVNTTTVPANYTVTTATKKSFSISGGGSCSSQFDFGFAKPNITVSGTLYNDKNGLMDNLVNGIAIGNPGGSTFYAYLADATDSTVLFKTTVNASNGAYSFTQAEITSSYVVVLSTISKVVGDHAPLTPGCPNTWVGVGETFGTNNAAGTGNESGIPNVSIAVKTLNNSVTGVNFGVERTPTSDDYLRAVAHPSVGQMIILNGQGMNPPVLSGNDPEDCSSGCQLSAKNVVIDTVPTAAELYYNNALVVNGQLITNFNANLLQLKITSATMGATSVQFNYSYVDAAMVKAVTPATYRLVWLIAVPVVGLTATADLNNDDASVNWSTQSEQNTSHYIVERSIDGKNFITVGQSVAAAGNSTDKRSYHAMDNIANVNQNEIIYYRIRLVDIDGKESYSNIVTVRVNKRNTQKTAVWPNPFQGNFTVAVTSSKETSVSIKLITLNGQVVKTINQQVVKGTTHIVIKDLERIAAGTYMAEVTDSSGERTLHKMIKL